MANEVTIVVKSRDESGRGFDSSTKKAKGLKGHLSALGGSFKGLAAGALAFGAIDMFKGMISEARESEQVTKRTNEVIKSTGGVAKVTATQVGELATALSNKTGVDDEVIQSGENMLLTFKNIRNEAGKGNDIFNRATRATADLAAGMHNGEVTSEGMQKASIQLGKALNDPIKGITALSRVGVTFSQKQKDMIKHFVETGQVAKAQKIILKELESEFGGAAESGTTAAQKLSTHWKNLQEAMGAKLLPVIDKIATKLIKLVDFVSAHGNWVGPITAGLVGLALALKGVAVAQGLANSAALSNPYVAIAVAIIALGAAAVVAYNKFQSFRNIVRDVAVNTGQVFIRVGQIITTALLGAFNIVVQGAAKAFGWIPGIGPKIKRSAADIAQFTKDVHNSFNHASDALEGLQSKAKRKIAIKANIKDLDAKISAADAKLKTVHGKTATAKIKANIADLESKYRQAIAELGKLNKKTATSKMKGHIADLLAKVAAAKRSLNSVPKSKQSALRAYIAQLQAQVAAARRALASVRSKTVYINGIYRGMGDAIRASKATGGIIGAQGGGPRSRMTLVGENGPELADLAPGTTVHSNPDTRRIMSQSGGGQRVVLEFAGNPSSALDRLLWEWIKSNVRVRGGKGPTSVQKALGA